LAAQLDPAAPAQSFPQRFGHIGFSDIQTGTGKPPPKRQNHGMNLA
jgi:hypothetical protein